MGKRSYACGRGSEAVAPLMGAWPLEENEGWGHQNGRSGGCEDRKKRRKRKQVGGDSWPRRRALMKRLDWRDRRSLSGEAEGSG